MVKATITFSMKTSIKISSGIVKEIDNILSKETHDKALVVYDRALLKNGAKKLLKHIIHERTAIGMEGGEKLKTINNLQKLWRLFSKNNLTRKSIVVGVGGGSLLDLTGFAASTYLRGIRFISIPTTLLAQADASIGGKNGVNLDGKNIIGTIYHPSHVIIDPLFLKFQPQEQFVDGLAEIIKHAIIDGDNAFSFIEKNITKILERNTRVLEKTLRSSVKTKLRIVRKDPVESWERMKLNLGHTIGHAIEAISNYKISHGKSISIGLFVEAFFSHNRGMLDEKTLKRIERMLGRTGLPLKPPIKLELEKLAKAIYKDKKRRGQFIFIPIIHRIGEITIEKIKIESLVREAWSILN